MRLNSKQITRYTGGRYLIEPIDSSEILTGITWDSRRVKPGYLYVALPGEHHDGHQFVESALRSGARGALVTDAPNGQTCVLARELGAAIIEVPNTFHAVADLAREWRGHLSATVIGVTGSVGKTTTKNLIRDVAASSFKTVATEANQNNELGVPNTLLAADPDTRVVVVEMGMRGKGQIKELCEIARPDWGIITNINECHMELLGSIENIAAAKAELFEALPSGSGKAFVNIEEPFASTLVAQSRALERHVSLIAYGGSEADDGVRVLKDVFSSEAPLPRVWAANQTVDSEGRPEFALCAEGFHEDGGNPEATLFDIGEDAAFAECHLNLRGEHNILNACAAAAVGCALHIPLPRIAEALSNSTSETGRLEMLVGRDGFTVINDSYNANPDSMKAALNMLGSMDVKGRRIAVLGDMGELGSVEVPCHRSIGAHVASLPIDMLICIGDLSAHIADGAREAGMDPSCIIRARHHADVLSALEGGLDATDVVLVKASHFMDLGRIVEGLIS